LRLEVTPRALDVWAGIDEEVAILGKGEEVEGVIVEVEEGGHCPPSMAGTLRARSEGWRRVNNRQLLRRPVNRRFHNVAFADAQRLVEALGFRLVRVSGDHFIYEHPSMPEEMLNLQPRRGETKAYQLRELLGLIELYDLSLEGDS
jgi:predicted RNA binding protein YcfA (HicA-like mRNA interferase family)